MANTVDFASQDSLPASLVQPVIVKNTFLDFDDSAVHRLPTRAKTEGAALGCRTLTGSTFADGDSDDDDQSSDNTSPGSPICHLPTGSPICHWPTGSSLEGFAIPMQQQVRVSQLDPTHCVDEKAVVDHFTRRGPAPSVACVETSDPFPANASISVFESHTWTVDAKKLRGNDRSVVSRPFSLAIGGPTCPVVACKMMLYAKTVMDRKGGQSFKQSGGQGTLQLKCEHDLTDSMENIVELRFSLGTNGASREVKHDFAQSAACTSQDWDFSKAVNKKKQTFEVHVEVVSKA